MTRVGESLGFIAIGVVITLVITALWRRADRLRVVVYHRLRPSAHRAADAIVNDTVEAQIWHRPPPLVFPWSVAYLREHGDAFWAPSATAAQRGAAADMADVISIPTLCANPSAYAGRRIAVIANYSIANPLGPALDGRQTWVVQLRSAQPGGELCLLYCRVVLPRDFAFDPQQLVMVAGVVLAAGGVTLLNHQVRNGAYLVAGTLVQFPKVEADPASSPSPA